MAELSRPARLPRHWPELRGIARDLAPHFADPTCLTRQGWALLEAKRPSVIRAVNERLSALPLEARASSTRVLWDLSDEVSRLAAFDRWGRATFRFEADVLSALSATGLSGVLMSDVHVPYPCVYLDFAPCSGTGFEVAGERLEGAWVRQSPDRSRLMVGLCTVAKPGALPVWRIDECYPLHLGSCDSRRLGDALHESIAALQAGLADGRAALEAEAVQLRIARQGRTDVAVVPQTGDERQVAALTEHRPEIEAALSIVGNALCLLCARPEGVIGSPEWIPPLPQTDLPPKAERRVAAEHGALLMRRITLGEPLPRDPAMGDGVSPRAHWRRGHWWRQRVGQGLSETRLLWIRPVLVAGSGGEPARDTIYSVPTQPNAEQATTG